MMPLHPAIATSARSSRPLRMPPLLLLVLLLAWCCVDVFAATQATAPPAPAAQTAQTAPEEPAAALAALEQGDVRQRFDLTFDRVIDRFLQLAAGTPLLLAAALIVLLASWLGGFISRRLHWLRLRSDNPYLDGLIRNIVRTLVVLVGVLIALDLLNATSLVGAVLGSAGVVGLVLGFAFKDIAENYVAGILLSLRQPFSPGDHVRIDGNEGKVVALNSRATMLMTLDGNELRLPNAMVFKAIILNFTHNPKRRFDFTVTIDPGQSIREAHALALEQIRGTEGVLHDPGPSWGVQEYQPSGIVLQFFGWVDQRSSDLGKVRSEAIRRVKAALANAGIALPRTVYHIVATREHEAAKPSAPTPEPVHDGDADTSVNRDIDEQLAQAQRAAVVDGRNLLDAAPAGNPAEKQP